MHELVPVIIDYTLMCLLHGLEQDAHVMTLSPRSILCCRILTLARENCYALFISENPAMEKQRWSLMMFELMTDKLGVRRFI